MRVAGLLLTIVLVAACGGGNDDDQADTVNAPTSTPTSATEPIATMTHAEAEPPATDVPTEANQPTETEAPTATDEPAPHEPTATTEPDPTATTEPESTATAIPEEPTEQPEDTANVDLSAALLQLEDMPVGWTTAPELLEDDDEESSGICGHPALTENFSWEIDVETAFKQSDLGPFIIQGVGRLSESDAIEAMAFLRNSVDCTDSDGQNHCDGPM